MAQGHLVHFVVKWRFEVESLPVPPHPKAQSPEKVLEGPCQRDWESLDHSRKPFTTGSVCHCFPGWKFQVPSPSFQAAAVLERPACETVPSWPVLPMPHEDPPLINNPRRQLRAELRTKLNFQSDNRAAAVTHLPWQSSRVAYGSGLDLG